MRPSDLTLSRIRHGFFVRIYMQKVSAAWQQDKFPASKLFQTAKQWVVKRLPYYARSNCTRAPRGLGTGLVKIPLLLESGRFEGLRSGQLSRTTKHDATMRWAPAEYYLQCLVVAFCVVFPLVSVHRDGDTSM